MVNAANRPINGESKEDERHDQEEREKASLRLLQSFFVSQMVMRMQLGERNDS